MNSRGVSLAVCDLKFLVMAVLPEGLSDLSITFDEALSDVWFIDHTLGK